MASSSNAKPTILIVPGFYFTPFHYERLVASLAQSGYPSHAVSLPSAQQADGDTSAPQDPCEDLKTVRRKLEELVIAERKTVVLLCHSLGGVVGSRAVYGFERSTRRGDGQAGGIIGVVWLAAILAREGEDMDKALRGRQLDWIEGKPTDPTTHVPRDRAQTHLFNDLPATSPLLGPAVSALRPAHRHGSRVPPTGSCWHLNMPMTYLITAKDAAVDLNLQHSMVDKIKNAIVSGVRMGWRSVEGGHACFVGAPDEVAAVVVAEVEAVVRVEGEGGG